MNASLERVISAQKTYVARAGHARAPKRPTQGSPQLTRYTFAVAERIELERPWWLLPVGRVHPLWWIAVGLATIWIDYEVGPVSQLPNLYIFPVLAAAWYSGRSPAVAIAVAAAASHLVFLMTASQPSAGLTFNILITIVRSAVIIVMAFWFARLSEHERQLHRYMLKLEGLLPICSVCKSIRNEAGNWESLEAFISERSDADFSHGLCPECLRRHYSTS